MQIFQNKTEELTVKLFLNVGAWFNSSIWPLATNWFGHLSFGSQELEVKISIAAAKRPADLL